MSNEVLLAPTFLFRFSAPLSSRKQIWSKSETKLSEAFRLPSFGELEQRPRFADVRAAWNRQGLTFLVRVTGKQQTAWCRANKIDDSDGLHLFIDTRDTHNIHRATRFCHHFIFLPFGDGPDYSQPVARLVDIHRARENPKPIAGNALQVRSQKRIDGYLLEAHIPAAALTGFAPDDHPRLGFTYGVMDRELGWQTFSVGTEFRFQEDPSLWGTLELQSKSAS